jgi:hypothetical protein
LKWRVYVNKLNLVGWEAWQKTKDDQALCMIWHNLVAATAGQRNFKLVNLFKLSVGDTGSNKRAANEQPTG